MESAQHWSRSCQWPSRQPAPLRQVSRQRVSLLIQLVPESAHRDRQRHRQQLRSMAEHFQFDLAALVLKVLRAARPHCPSCWTRVRRLPSLRSTRARAGRHLPVPRPLRYPMPLRAGLRQAQALVVSTRQHSLRRRVRKRWGCSYCSRFCFEHGPFMKARRLLGRRAFMKWVTIQ